MKLFRFTFLLLTLGAAAALHAQNAEPRPTEIKSDMLDMKSTDTETTSVFTGNVVVIGTGVKMTCDRLEVVAFRKGDPKATIGKIENFKSLIATGNVNMLQGGREAAAGRAEVLPGEDKVILSGSPVIKDHDTNTVATGDVLVLHRGQRQITGTNVRIVAPELKDLGVDKDKLLNNPAPPAPATAPAPKQP
jgi:lipopolysaccharide export system protein LptA